MYVYINYHVGNRKVHHVSHDDSRARELESSCAVPHVMLTWLVSHHIRWQMDMTILKK